MHPSVAPPLFKAGGRSPYTQTQTQLLCQISKTPSRPPVGLAQSFVPLIFSSNLPPPSLPPPYHPSNPSPPPPLATPRTYGDHLEVWRGRCLGVLSLQNVAAKGAWLAQTTCSPGSLWRGMFNSLIPLSFCFSTITLH